MIRVSVDAREVTRKILHAHLTIPTTPGPLTLFYPKWIPGEHAPTGPIVNLVGIKISDRGPANPLGAEILLICSLFAAKSLKELLK